MTTALAVNSSECSAYSTSYGTGEFEGCLVQTSISFGPFKIENATVAAAETVGDALLDYGGSFR